MRFDAKPRVAIGTAPSRSGREQTGWEHRYRSRFIAATGLVLEDWKQNPSWAALPVRFVPQQVAFSQAELYGFKKCF